MPDATATIEPPTARPLPLRLAVAAAVMGCALLTGLLSVRQINSIDMGYHLDYGEHFLDTGQVVDTNPYIYTLPQFTHPAKLPEAGPGNWYDAQGAYRFPNANWGSQIVMALFHRYGGAMGLCVLQAAIICGIAVLTLLSARRLGAPWLWAAAGLLLASLVAYERFNLRPEVFGYLLLAAELYVLVGRQAGWRLVIVLGVLQLLLVNLHSYFMLGLALTGGFLADPVIRLAWHAARRTLATPAAGDAKRRAAFLGLALAAQIAVCFVNPWTWRLAILPAQTLVFMRDYVIGPQAAATGHPWSFMGEMFGPFEGSVFVNAKATAALVVLLALTGLGGLAALLRRRWDILALLAMFTSTGISMRRNIALYAMLCTPLAMAAIWEMLAWACRRLGERPRRGKAAARPSADWLSRPAFAWAGAGSLLLAAGLLSAQVVTQRFYIDDRMPWRFGAGFLQTTIPLATAQWLTDHKPAGHVWTDQECSSSIRYFTQPRPDVPLLTNTWAYPPEIMAENIDILRGRRQYSEIFARQGVNTVAVAFTQIAVPNPATARARGDSEQSFALRLYEDPAWKLVCIDGQHLIFLRTDGPNADLARRAEITEVNLDVAAFIRQHEQLDPYPAGGLCIGGTTLMHLRWYSEAIPVLRAAVEHDSTYAPAWSQLGVSLAEIGRAKLQQPAMIEDGLRDLRKARDAFAQALSLRPDDALASANLELVQHDLAGRPRR